VLTVALSLVALAAGSAQAPRHDFDRDTLASYLSLRFSSAVPPAVIERVLATEGFSQDDLALVRQAAAAARSYSAPVEATSGASPTASGAGRHVHPARQISRDRLDCPNSDPECELDTEAEPDIGVDPTNPRNLVGTFQQGRYPGGGAVNVGWSASFNGGMTWPAKGSMPGLTVAVSDASTAGPGAPFERASDPVVSFDRKHDRVYINTLSVSESGCAVYCDSALTVNISRNGGRSFNRPVIAHEDVEDPDSPQFAFNDKNWIVTDNHPHSPYYGRTYIAWDQVRCGEPSCSFIEQPVMLVYSNNGGRIWRPRGEGNEPIQVTHAQPAQSHQEVGVQPVVLPNGHLVIVYADATAGAYTFVGDYAAVRSKDGGRHWSSPHMIDTANPYAEEGGSLRAPNVPSATVAGGRIYVAFQDQRFTPGRNDILLTSSKDEGRTWSTPVNVTPGESDLDHFTPDIAAQDGVIHLTYRTREPGNLNSSPQVNTMYRSLRHGGKKPGRPIQLGRTSDSDVAAFTEVAGSAPLKFFGDYAGIAAGSSGPSHPIWGHAHTFKNQRDNPTDTHQRSYSSRVG
jgi:hypothetical protein